MVEGRRMIYEGVMVDFWSDIGASEDLKLLGEKNEGTGSEFEITYL